MTIQRKMASASVYSVAGTDTYGQRTYGQTPTTISISVFPYMSESYDGPNAVDETVEGITKASLNVGDKVVIGLKSYVVTKVIPGRLNQAFMRLI